MDIYKEIFILWNKLGERGAFDTRVDKNSDGSVSLIQSYSVYDSREIYVSAPECVLAYLHGRLDGEGF